MPVTQRSPEWWAERNVCRAAWHAALVACRAGNTTLQAAKFHEYRTLCERLGLSIDTSLAAEPRAGHAIHSIPVHAGDSAADIFARRRAQASAANQERVHGSAPDRAARAAGSREPIDSASVYERRRQSAERIRAAGAAED